MPINSPHPIHKNFSSKWVKCRDCYEGEEIVKEKGTLYLPLLSSMPSDSDEKYKSYKRRAMFYGATARTVEGLVGMVMRKDPIIKVPPKFEDRLKDITGTGITINNFIKNALSEVLLTGRYSIHADRGADQNKLPYLVGTIAESVTNWRYDEEGKLLFVVLREVVIIPSQDDAYVMEEIEQYREFFMEEGKAKSRLWREDETKDWNVVKDSEVELTLRGKAIDHIPHTFVNVYGTSNDLTQPPLLGMVNVNLSHYRTYADLEHGRHFTGLPTPWVSGIDDDEFQMVKAPTGEGQQASNKKVFEIGSESILLLPEGAQAGFMEFSGKGLTFLENAAQEKIDLMAVLGARLLQNQKKGVEAAETARINKSGDSSILVSIAESVEAGIEIALKEAVEWEGLNGDAVEVTLNKDFLDVEINPQLLTALMSSWQQGAISHETFLFNLKKGEILDDDVSIEDEISKIKLEGPKLTIGAPPINLDEDEGESDKSKNK